MRFPYNGPTKPAGYWPRIQQPGFQTLTRVGPYKTFAGKPAIARFGFISGTLADYEGSGFYFDFPSEEVGQVYFQFYTSVAPAPPTVGIHLGASGALNIATAFHDFFQTYAWPTAMGYGVKTYTADYLDLQLHPQPAPSIRVQLTQPFPGVEGNFRIEVDSALDGVWNVNGIDVFEDADPLFFNGVSLAIPLLWGKQRALGPSSGSTPQAITVIG